LALLGSEGGKLDESRTVFLLIASRPIFGIDQGKDLAPSFVFKRSEETSELLVVLARQLDKLGCHDNLTSARIVKMI
jgi:hypothetical protein